MLNLGVISDTHLSDPGRSLPVEISRIFRGVDLILHAGDLTSIHVIQFLEDLAPVEAVHGNMDSGEVKGLLPPKRVIEVGGHSLGLIHGWGAPRGIRERIADQFQGVEAIVYGHTHQPFSGSERGIFFFNPGSVSRHPSGRATVGRIFVGESFRGEIIDL
jgi:putative phosphoesterase